MRFSLILPSLLLAAPAIADECGQLPKPSVSIKRLEEKLSFNMQYSYKSLTTLGASLARPGSQVLGLTRGNLSVQVATNSPAFVDRSGRWECSSPQITVTYGLSPLTVYVGREFPEGSCAYKEIYEHEMRHVKTYQAHSAGMEKIIADTFKARFASETPWRGPVGQTRDKLQQEINERWIPFIQREFNRVEIAQAQIDTAEEYERVANACNGEVKRLMRESGKAK